jgi:hypothetical protein
MVCSFYLRPLAPLILSFYRTGPFLLLFYSFPHLCSISNLISLAKISSDSYSSPFSCHQPFSSVLSSSFHPKPPLPEPVCPQPPHPKPFFSQPLLPEPSILLNHPFLNLLSQALISSTFPSSITRLFNLPILNHTTP